MVRGKGLKMNKPIISYILCALFFMFLTCEAAEPKEYIGKWEAGDSGTYSIYGVINITKNYVSWMKTNNLDGCKVKYILLKKHELPEVAESRAGDSVEIETKYPSKLYSRYKLKLVKNECIAKRGYFELFIPHDDEKYAEFIDYDDQGRLKGYGHLHKQ